MERVSDWIQLQRLTAGRRLQALTRMAKLVGTDDDAVLSAIEEAIALAQHVVHLERRYVAERADTAMHGERARHLDGELDKAVTGLYHALQAVGRALGDDHEDRERVDRLLALLFPKGAQAITRLTFVDEHAAVNALLDEVRDPTTRWSEDIVVMRLDNVLDRIEVINEEYGILLTQRNAALGSRTMRDAQRASYEAFARVVAMVLGRYPSDDEADTERRRTWLEPVADQQAEASQYRRAKSNRGDRSDDEPEALESDEAEALEPGEPEA